MLHGDVEYGFVGQHDLESQLTTVIEWKKSGRSLKSVAFNHERKKQAVSDDSLNTGRQEGHCGWRNNIHLVRETERRREEERDGGRKRE